MLDNIVVDREFISAFNQVRKCLKKEMGVDVRLSQQDVLETIKRLYEKTSNPDCIQSIETLFDISGQTSFVRKGSGNSKSGDQPEKEKMGSTTSSSKSTKKLRVYRGQVIEG